MRGKLTPKALAFIPLLAASTTTTEAIEKAGISEKTAYRWLKNPAFVDELRKARREVLKRATGKLTAEASSAVDVLAKIMNDPETPASTRTQAARIILDTAYNSIQADDLEQRIEQLEAGDNNTSGYYGVLGK